MFFALSKTLDLAFSPLFWCLVLALCCAWAARQGAAGRSRWLGVTALLSLYVPSTGACARFLFERVERFEGARVQPGERYDAVILLSGFAGRGPDGSVEVSDGADRLLRTWDLLRSGRARRVIISGGGVAGRIEADAIAELLQAFGLERSRMLLERKSLNTRENALFVKPLVERERLKRLVVVTSAFHMQRALECLRAVGLQADALATDHQTPLIHGWFDALLPRASHLATSERALREYAGRLVYRTRGYAATTGA